MISSEDHALEAFDTELSGKIFGFWKGKVSRYFRNVHSEELNEFYSPSSPRELGKFRRV
jgi:hypothetical protein